MTVEQKDRNILRGLATQVAEIAALPAQQQKIDLWKTFNSLEPSRPMVMIDQVCWHEMDVDGELTLQTEDSFCRSLETRLRRTLYSWKHMPVDMVVEPVIDVHKAIRNTGFGIQTREQRAVLDPRNDVVDIIRAIPRVRKVSMSPWVDVDRGAEQIGRDLVFSRKPSPAFLAPDIWSAEAVERDLRDTLKRCAPHGCPVEFILKDISTVRYQPQRLWEWAEIAMKVVGA